MDKDNTMMGGGGGGGGGGGVKESQAKEESGNVGRVPCVRIHPAMSAQCTYNRPFLDLKNNFMNYDRERPVLGHPRITRLCWPVDCR